MLSSSIADANTQNRMHFNAREAAVLCYTGELVPPTQHSQMTLVLDPHRWKEARAGPAACNILITARHFLAFMYPICHKHTTMPPDCHSEPLLVTTSTSTSITVAVTPIQFRTMRTSHLAVCQVRQHMLLQTQSPQLPACCGSHTYCSRGCSHAVSVAMRHRPWHLNKNQNCTTAHAANVVDAPKQTKTANTVCCDERWQKYNAPAN